MDILDKGGRSQVTVLIQQRCREDSLVVVVVIGTLVVVPFLVVVESGIIFESILAILIIDGKVDAAGSETLVPLGLRV